MTYLSHKLCATPSPTPSQQCPYEDPNFDRIKLINWLLDLSVIKAGENCSIVAGSPHAFQYHSFTTDLAKKHREALPLIDPRLCQGVAMQEKRFPNLVGIALSLVDNTPSKIKKSSKKKISFEETISLINTITRALKKKKHTHTLDAYLAIQTQDHLDTIWDVLTYQETALLFQDKAINTLQAQPSIQEGGSSKNIGPWVSSQPNLATAYYTTIIQLRYLKRKPYGQDIRTLITQVLEDLKSIKAQEKAQEDKVVDTSIKLALSKFKEYISLFLVSAFSAETITPEQIQEYIARLSIEDIEMLKTTESTLKNRIKTMKEIPEPFGDLYAFDLHLMQGIYNHSLRFQEVLHLKSIEIHLKTLKGTSKAASKTTEAKTKEAQTTMLSIIQLSALFDDHPNQSTSIVSPKLLQFHLLFEAWEIAIDYSFPFQQRILEWLHEKLPTTPELLDTYQIMLKAPEPLAIEARQLISRLFTITLNLQAQQEGFRYEEFQTQIEFFEQLNQIDLDHQPKAKPKPKKTTLLPPAPAPKKGKKPARPARPHSDSPPQQHPIYQAPKIIPPSLPHHSLESSPSPDTPSPLKELRKQVQEQLERAERKSAAKAKKNHSPTSEPTAEASPAEQALPECPLPLSTLTKANAEILQKFFTRIPKKECFDNDVSITFQNLKGLIEALGGEYDKAKGKGSHHFISLGPTIQLGPLEQPLIPDCPFQRQAAPVSGVKSMQDTLKRVQVKQVREMLMNLGVTRELIEEKLQQS